MTKEEQFLANKLLDMAERTYMSGRPEYSEFMNMNEQNIFLSTVNSLPPVNYTLVGGHIYAERKIAAFTSKDFENISNPPICAVKCTPTNMKFADDLTHRDYLGALMNLGINRNTIGDFVFDNNSCYIICLNSISEYISSELLKVKHTIIRTEIVPHEQISGISIELKETTGFISSNRLDSIVSLAFNLSRNASSEYISQGKVFINSRLELSNSYQVKEKDLISVRGLGRFIFNNIVTTTKKNRLMVSISKY